MKKNHQQNHFLDYFAFLILAVVLAGFVYGGLTINKLNKANQKLAQTQDQLEEKIGNLESKLIDSQNQLVDLNDRLDQNDKKLSYYRKLALDTQAELAKTKEESIANTITNAIQTVTKKVYVEKKNTDSTLTIEGLGSYKVTVTSGDNAFTILKKASDQYGLKISYDTFSFGVFVTEIGGIKPVGNQYWAFYYNGKYSQVGASDQKVSAGDTIYWRLESF